MIPCSLHNHCTMCDGRDDLSAMVRAAADAGITDFGMSCHSFVNFGGGIVRPYEHADHDVYTAEDDYIRTVRAFSEAGLPMACGGGRLNLYLGTEEDYIQPVRRRKDYDYIIGSVHYVGDGRREYAVDSTEGEFSAGISECFGGDVYAFTAEYYRRVAAEAERGVSIIGHPDLVRLYGSGMIDTSNKIYRLQAERAIEKCVSAGAILELNYGAVTKKKLDFPYPEEWILRLIRELGGRVIVSTDCHRADRVACGLSEGEALLRSLGFESVTVMKDGAFIERAL